jgi:putative transposase
VWLTTDGLLSAFSARRSEAVAPYAAFVVAGTPQPGPWEKLKNQMFLGAEAFVTHLQRTLTADARLREIPAVQRRPLPQPLAQITEEHERD